MIYKLKCGNGPERPEYVSSIHIDPYGISCGFDSDSRFAFRLVSLEVAKIVNASLTAAGYTGLHIVSVRPKKTGKKK